MRVHCEVVETRTLPFCCVEYCLNAPCMAASTTDCICLHTSNKGKTMHLVSQPINTRNCRLQFESRHTDPDCNQVCMHIAKGYDLPFRLHPDKMQSELGLSPNKLSDICLKSCLFKHGRRLTSLYPANVATLHSRATTLGQLSS